MPRARRTITAELDARIKSVAIHLENPDWEPWLDDLEVLVPAPADAGQTPAAPLWQRKRIADVQKTPDGLKFKNHLISF